MADFYLKVDDLFPPFEATLLDSSGQPIPLEGSTSKLRYWPWDSNDPADVRERVAAIVEPSADGTVRYFWVAGDTTPAGLYRAEVKVTLPGGKVVTCPNDSFFELYILDSAPTEP